MLASVCYTDNLCGIMRIYKQSIGSMNTELQGSIASGDEFSDVVEVASQILEGFGMTVDKNGILHK